jgi:CotH protein.
LVTLLIKKHTTKKLFLAALTVLFCATLFLTTTLSSKMPAENYRGDVITFSLDKLSYSGAQALELEIAEESGLAGEIRYTTDGSEPSIVSALYAEPIELGVIEGRGCHTIRAALFGKEERGRVYTRSYFIGGHAALDDDEYVVSITGNPGDFNGKQGLFYGPEELTEEEWYARDIVANYLEEGREWEKRVNIEIFGSGGETMLSQIAGVRIAGNYTRIFPVKSLRFYARGGYDFGYGKFDCGFLNQGTQPNGLEAVSFNQIELRNGGNNWEDTMLNDVFSRRLAADAGLDPIGVSRPAAVYINGEFYSFMWLQPTYCEKNLEEMLSLPDFENVRVMKGIERGPSKPSMAALDYAWVYKYITLSDMTKQSEAQAADQMVDIGHIFLYYAIEMYLRNTDWLMNNVGMWKYAGEPVAGNKYTDGRWRFFLYDADHTLGYDNYSMPGVDSFEWIFVHERGMLLRSMLENNGLKSRFVNIYCDLLATALDSKKAIGILEEIISQTTLELEYREQTRPDRFNADDRLSKYDVFREFLAERPGYIHDSLAEYLGAGGMYSLEVTNSDAGAEIAMNAGYVTLGYDETLSGSYYKNNPCIITANYVDGYKFDYWLVNGKKIETETLTLDEKLLGDAQNITVSLVTKRTENAEPVMTRMSYKGADDWIEITNPGAAPLSLAGYYLSDKVDNPHKYALPAITLAAGESIIIYSNDNVYAPLGAYQFGFKMAQYETVILSGSGGMLEEVYMPNSQEGYIYGRRPYSGGWQYIKTPEDIENG